MTALHAKAANAFLKGVKPVGRVAPVKSEGWAKTHQIYEHLKGEVAVLNGVLGDAGVPFSLEVELDAGHQRNGVILINIKPDSDSERVSEEVAKRLPECVASIQPRYIELPYVKPKRGREEKVLRADFTMDQISEIVGNHTLYIAEKLFFKNKPRQLTSSPAGP